MESGIGWQGEGVAEKEVARGRSSRGLMMVSFCSIVWSLVAGSSALRGRWLASLHTSARRVPGALASRGAGANTALAARRLAGPCVYNNACKHFEICCMYYRASNIKHIKIIEDANNSSWLTIAPRHSQTNKDECRKEKARVPIETRFLPSADSISDKSRASHLSISSPVLPEVARHHCMSHPIDRSINLHKLSSYCMHACAHLLSQ